MSKQIEDIKEIKLLDSQVHLCEEIRKLLRKKKKKSTFYTGIYRIWYRAHCFKQTNEWINL